MSQAALEKALFWIMNAEIRPYPYPHFVADGVLSEEFYEELLAKLPPLESYVGIGGGGMHGDDGGAGQNRYRFRFAEDMDKLPEDIRSFWAALGGFMLSERFANALLDKFATRLGERFRQRHEGASISTRMELLRDFSGYSLGPHTDTGERLLGLFIYLPADNDNPALGTSVYVPKDPDFSCAGGRRHPFERFNRVYTAPFIRGSAFGYLRGDRAFHGVEPIETEGFERNVLAFSMYAD